MLLVVMLCLAHKIQDRLARVLENTEHFVVKARAVLLWHALAHNLKRMTALNFEFAA